MKEQSYATVLPNYEELTKHKTKERLISADNSAKFLAISIDFSKQGVYIRRRE